MTIPSFEQKTIELGDKTYVLTKFPATKGIKYQKKLAKVLLPSIAEIMKGDQATFGSIMEKVSEHLDELEEDFIKELVVFGAGVSPQAYEYEFSGNYMNLFNLVVEIIKFNFMDVFTVLGLEEVKL